MKEYVLGFMFSDDLSHVLLIQKNHPDWQKGKLNGIGGHLEEKELPKQGIMREFLEETGLTTTSKDWRLFGTYKFPKAIIYCFCGISDMIFEAKSMTEEQIALHATEFTFGTPSFNFWPRMDNLDWLIPLAKYTLSGNAWDGELFYYQG